ncbi:hypothetical protein ACQP2T_04665 [Nonomuraea sp. CA-143628]|uniref:hypothetical protein n=1 Tax=Nonomuraea sp. CA-143628 TaxID=3239997 RepID=UPI003D920119
MNEISRRDEVSLSGAALRGAPWKTAAVSGGATAAVSFVLGVLSDSAGLVWSLGLGISVFALVAAIGAVSKPNEGDRVTRQARLWALKHPWRFALLPAAITAVLDYPVQLVLDGEGVFGSAVQSIWHGALVYVIAGVLTLTRQGRARSSQ